MSNLEELLRLQRLAHTGSPLMLAFVQARLQEIRNQQKSLAEEVMERVTQSVREAINKLPDGVS